MSKRIELVSYDGTKLVADYYESERKFGALLTHGITSERTEGGLYSAMANALKIRSITALTLDIRCHGESDGEQEEFYLSGAINDICSGIDFLISVGVSRIILISASFSGGLAIRAAELKSDVVSHLVLLNPRLDYTPWIKDRDLWVDGQFTSKAKKDISSRGYVERKGFKLGQPMINELLSFDPTKGRHSLDKPILFIHGMSDSVIPIESSRNGCRNARLGKLIEIPNAQHGFTDPATDDPQSKKSREIRATVIEKSIQWIENEVRENNHE